MNLSFGEMSNETSGDMALRRAGIVLVTFGLLLPACATDPEPSFDLDRALAHVQQGQTYLQDGLTDSALAQFGLALEADPTFLDAHLHMGAIYRGRGDFDLASRCYERAVAVDPDNFDARYFWGWMQHLQGRIEEAIANYLRALTIRPDDFDANLNIGGAYLQLSRPAAALPYARHATGLQPDSQAAWANLATVHGLLQQYEDAIGAYRQAIELGPSAQPMLLGLANAHLALQHHEQAIIVLQSAIQDTPTAGTYRQMGYAQFKTRQFAEALESFRAAVALEETDHVAMNGVGVCLMALYLQDDPKRPERHEEALNAWRWSLQIDPHQPHIVDLISRYLRL